MRIIKGSKVEVWTQDAAPPMGAWRGGEVHCGNGHSYILRWFDGGPESGRIPRKFVRPCPPPVPLPADLDAGDMVEVFDDCLWKCAEVVSAAGGGQFDVKIIGSTRVVTAGLTMLRVRQVLREDDVWVALQGNEIPGAMALPLRAIPGKHSKGKGKGVGNGGGKSATPAFKWGKVKRSRCMMGVERFAGDTKRLCVKEEAARYDENLEVIDVNPAILQSKQQEMSSEDCDVVGTDSNSDDNTKSVSSSVGSSSASGGSSNNSGDRAVSTTSKPCEDQNANQLQQNCKEEQSDDRTESRVSARKHPANEGAMVAYQEGKVRRLQLDAYTALMRVFHATGSLTWKKEELLSNLRLHLNISSDKHLQVIWELHGRTKPGRPGRS